MSVLFAAEPGQPEIGQIGEPGLATTTQTTPTEPGAASPLSAVVRRFVVPSRAPEREMDEIEPLDIFGNRDIAEILIARGEREPFKYNAKGRPDPMIVPWILNEVLSKEYLAQAQAYIKRAETIANRQERIVQYELAIKELDRVIEIDPTNRDGREAARLKSEVQEKMGPGGEGDTGTAKDLPEAVVNGTKAIIFDDSPAANHVALVGGNEVKVGETVPGHDDVKVVEITRDAVVYEYKQFRVSIVPKTPELDPWILANTKAVVFDTSDEGKHIVLIGDSMLLAGDVVPQFKDVKIAEITRDAVVFELEGVRLKVAVEVEVKKE